ncbi:hypothetical protein CTI12_AA386240 [Artemisia annua]|uniref:Uncharacterized protein n=1 Tax=Artemisia annua TaxID=35608 RepID=A0A2U1MFG6_ARTAN|nr:hypothetical protein CTI12_AA386240 [Artemisia annua]
MAKDLSDLRKEVKFLTTAFKEIYGAGAYKDMIFEDVTCEDAPSTQDQEHQRQQDHNIQEHQRQHEHNIQEPLGKMWQSLWQSSMQIPSVSRVQNAVQASSQG